YRLLHIVLLLLTVTGLLAGVFVYARRAVPWRWIACGWGLGAASVALALALSPDIATFTLVPTGIAALGLVATAWCLLGTGVEGRAGAHRGAAVGFLLFAVYTATLPVW